MMTKNGSDFDSRAYAQWMGEHMSIAIAAAMIYLVLVYAGRRWMNANQPLSLRAPLFVWNVGLALFSVGGAFRTVSYLWRALATEGYFYSVCDATFMDDAAVGVWILVFAWSKMLEFGDTAFIVLRKQHLTFLHWYHHVLTFFLCWTYYSARVSLTLWSASMNFTVHALMYSYYALRAARIPVPATVQILITVLQITQMIFGSFCVAIVYYILRTGAYPECGMTIGSVYGSFIMYFSYTILFFNFFFQRYVLGGKKEKKV